MAGPTALGGGYAGLRVKRLTALADAGGGDTREPPAAAWPAEQAFYKM